MLKYGIAAVALVTASPALAQIDKGCYNYSGQNVWTAKNADKLREDINCFKNAKGLADISIANREKRIAQLVGPIVEPIKLDPLDPKDIVPINDNFDPYAEKLIYKGPEAPSAGADPVGAFRFTCWPTTYNYDDSIVAPGKIGGSMHGHENFGNTLGNGKSNYVSLRTTGESSCHNKVNRSHYWLPWLENEKNEIVRAEQISLYYKRLPASAPECQPGGMSLKGCVQLPNGFRAIAGYDPARFGKDQPENAVNYHWRCNGTKSDQNGEHRGTIDEALADCKLEKYGSVQIIATLNFPNCWNGQLDSADHRSHLANTSYGSWGYPKCPDTHPYVILGLTESAIFNILKSDGRLRLSCDKMAGMDMTLPGGKCFHGDYREAWSPKFLTRIHTICINLRRDCSYANFGDGEFLTPQPDTRNLPRTIPIPARS